MKKVLISDITLREAESNPNLNLSFKEKIATAKLLDGFLTDVIEMPPIRHGKTDILYLHTIAPLLKHSVLSCVVDLTEDAAEQVYDAIREAKKPRLHLMIPVSTVQMEYLCGKKPKAMLETVETMVQKCVSLTPDVEVTLLDATRAESEFLYEVTRLAIRCGAKTVTVCDTIGNMLPTELSQFMTDLQAAVPELGDVCLSAECTNAFHMATASAISCLTAGVSQIKACSVGRNYCGTASIAHLLQEKSSVLQLSDSLDMTILDQSIRKIRRMAESDFSEVSTFTKNINVEAHSEKILLTPQDDYATVQATLKHIGYDLSDEDSLNVYREVARLAENKTVGEKELDAIVASVAMQVPSTYTVERYMTNAGNTITPTALIALKKNGEVLQGLSPGTGPIDAAFHAIEQITGHHYELDDFQIQSVTEGGGAMASAIIKLRNNGVLYSGKGVSVDIVGAGINAYVNALNKIIFEEQ